MKSEEFVQAMNEVDDKYIKEAAGYKGLARRSMKIWRGIAIAACACLAVSLVLSAAVIEMGSGGSGYAGSYTDGGAKSARGYEYGSVAEEETAYAGKDYAETLSLNAPMNADMGPAEVWNASGAAGDIAQKQSDTKIIYSVWMDMQTREFDAAAARLESVVSEHGGYISNQYISNASYSYRSASYTVRIPVEELDAFVAQAGDICTVTYISKNAEDVSEYYYDTESRLNTAKAKLERLQELLTQAENMEDIISIENAIADVQLDIDNYSGTLKSYDSRISYSTVDISLSEVYQIEDDNVPMSFGEKISNAFTRGIKSVVEFGQDLAVWIVNSWIWLIIAAVIIVIAVKLIVKAVKKK